MASPDIGEEGCEGRGGAQGGGDDGCEWYSGDRGDLTEGSESDDSSGARKPRREEEEVGVGSGVLPASASMASKALDTLSPRPERA